MVRERKSIWHAGDKINGTPKFRPPQIPYLPPSMLCYSTPFDEAIYMQIDQIKFLIAGHFSTPFYACFQTVRHAPYPLINEVLEDMTPPFQNQAFRSHIVPMRIFIQLLFDWLPAVFNW